MHVISLTREDAEKLEYNNADAWKSLIRRHLNEIAEAHRIDVLTIHSLYLTVVLTVIVGTVKPVKVIVIIVVGHLRLLWLLVRVKEYQNKGNKNSEEKV